MPSLPKASKKADWNLTKPTRPCAALIRSSAYRLRNGLGPAESAHGACSGAGSIPRTSTPCAATFAETRSPQCVSISRLWICTAPGTDLLCCCEGKRDWFDFGGAEFVFRDLAERVELRVGQHIGGCFGVAEWDKHLARSDGAVGSRLQLKGAAAGGDADLVAGGDAERAQFRRCEAGDRFGLELVEHARPSGYRPGVPMFELAAGGQHHRVLGIGLLGRAWIGHRALALEPLPGDVVERRHCPLHLGEHVARMGVGPVEPDAARDLLDDPPIEASIAG